MLLRTFTAAAIFSIAARAFATPQPIDATDLWINPSESGWGISVFHQGDTLFASLFVYGPDGQPKWYTASNLQGGPSVYSGSLVEAAGPYLGASLFDSNAVTRRVVGSMTMTLDDTGANLSYSVDGTQVTKRVNRFSMRQISLNGGYWGTQLQPAAPDGTGEVSRIRQHIDVFDNGQTLSLANGSDIGSTCEYSGNRRSQDGESVASSGTVACNGGPAGNWSMRVDPSTRGFVGTFTGTGINSGRIAASRRTGAEMLGVGWINDLWFPAHEAGWGLNMIEQGDTAFATLFVYDAKNRPHWYSASNLKSSLSGATATWSGTLEESTGPYLGAAFDPSAVTRRAVGTLTFQAMIDGGSAQLSYNVDGVQVVKDVKRFAFRRNDLSGRYLGNVVRSNGDPLGGTDFDAQIAFDDQGSRVNIVIDLNAGVGSATRCTYSGDSFQSGAARAVEGSYTCQDGRQGSFRMDDLLVTASGLTGSYKGPGLSGNVTIGNISGARR
jgi:hypothetical protein